ncbi:MAG: glycerol-3-phosphate dehydrogenase [Hyphomicrobiales bacterium]|nr:glycerol-3-phosphate dehydrogenase [Hyphomicrobiales bacterium]
MTDLGDFELAVVGGGVNGAGIARDAAGRGLSVLLVEKDDFAQGASSRSSKLVHGGLRYLEHYEFRLVRESLIEREVLLRAAPHVVRPMRFVLPHSPRQRPAWLVRLGLFLYDHLGGRELLPPSRSLDLGRAPEGAPLRHECSRGFVYSDCWVDDARLVILNVLDASRLGARTLARTALVSARRDGGLWSLGLRSGSSESNARARALINASGPWVETVSGAAGASSRKRVRLVKGSHLVTRKFWEGEQAYLLQNVDRRVVFVSPYEEDFALIGTTDVPFAGAPEDAAIQEAEVDYLLGVVGRYFSSQPARSDILRSVSGVRPLFDDGTDDASAVTRDYAFDLDAPPGVAPLLTILGGKITTYRRLAEQALDRLRRFFPAMRPAWTNGAALPGGALEGLDCSGFLRGLETRFPWLPAPIASDYARRYGTRADDLLLGARALKDLGRHFGERLYEREARFLASQEFAVAAEDVLERRTKHTLRLTPAERRAFEAWFDGQGRTENGTLFSPGPFRLTGK